jgi:membrane-associated phospholipid phosphatase
VAAFPSEHAAMPFLELLAFRVAAPKVSYVLYIWIALVWFTIIFLGEHWVTDAIAGGVYALVAWLLVRGFVRIRGPRLPSRQVGS